YPVLRIARSVHDLADWKKWEFALHAPDVFEPSTKQADSLPSSVIVVHSAQTHQSDTMEVTVPTLHTSRYSKRAGVTPGIHFVQLVIDGDVVGRSDMFKAISQPIQINVEKNRYAVKCK